MSANRKILATTLLSAASAATVLFAPLWILLLSPIILGVPHVAADIRYLVLDPPGGRQRELLLVLVPVLLLLICGVAAVFGVERRLGVEIALGMGAIGLALIQTAPQRGEEGEGARLLLLAVLLVVTAFLLKHQRETQLVLMHLHNYIAMAIWFTLFQGTGSRREGQTILLVLLCSLIVVGVGGLVQPELAAALGSPAGFGPREAAAVILPGLSLPFAGAVIRLYAFSQLTHYIVWLFLVPSAGNRRTLTEDFGLIGTTVLALLIAAVLGAGAFFPIKTRELYLTASSFHAWLEIACGAFLLLATGRTVGLSPASTVLAAAAEKGGGEI